MAFDPVKIRIGATDETGRAFRSVETGLGGIEKTGVRVGKVLANLAGPVSVAGVLMIGKNALAAGDEIATLSARLGVGAVALSQYKYVAGQTGTDLETLARGLKFAERNVAEAAAGNKTLADRFRSVGLAVSDLKAMSPQSAFEAIGAAIAGLPTEGERVAAAMDLLGKAGADLIPTFAGGAESIAAMRAEADRLGVTRPGIPSRHCSKCL